MKRAACFEVPMWHAQQWEEQRDLSQSAPIVAEEGDKRAAGFAETLMPELFHRLYSESPYEVPEENRDSAARVRGKLHKLAGELPEMASLRKQTIRDPLWAGLATTCLSEAIVSAVPEPTEPPPDPEGTQNILDGLIDMGIGGDHTAKTEGKARGEVFALADQADDLDESTLRQALRRGIENAQEAIDTAVNAQAAFGIGGGALEGKPRSAQQAYELARRVRGSNKLAKIAALAGRLQATARAKRASRTEYARSEVVGIEQTGSLARLLPSELCSLASPLRTADLIRRLGERSAMGYKLHGKEKESKGPLVVLLDNSGSMAGGRDIWSRAIALALLDIARQDRRAFTVALFSHDIEVAYETDDATKVDPAALAHCFERESVGGTNYTPAFQWALRNIGGASKKKTFKRADVVLITDGAAPVKDAPGIRRELARLGAHSFGIGIGHENGMGPALAAWCDEVTGIDDVSEDTKATDLVFLGI